MSHEIVVQVGPNINISLHAKDGINLKLLDLEAEMVVYALVQHDLIPPKQPYNVKFRNDDLGTEVKYPVVVLKEKIYALDLHNQN